MKFLVLSACISLAYCGVITHDDHGKATSYQSIHMEHYHAVPTYIKDKHLLEHPVSVGSSKSNVEVHHGNKHEHGYAVASVHNDVHGHSDGGQEVSVGGGHVHYQAHEDAGQDDLSIFSVSDEKSEGILFEETPIDKRISNGQFILRIKKRAKHDNVFLGNETANINIDSKVNETEKYPVLVPPMDKELHGGNETANTNNNIIMVNETEKLQPSDPTEGKELAEGQDAGSYQNHDQGHDYSQYVSQLAHAQSQGGGYGHANLGHYQLAAAVHEDEQEDETKGVAHYQVYAQPHQQ